MGRAFSELIAFQIAGTPGIRPIHSTRLHSFDRVLGARPISAPGISTEYTQALLSGASRIAYGDYSVRNGKLEAHLTIEDPRAPKMIATFTAAAPQGDILAAATALARDISPQAKPYSTTRGDALSSYIQALESSDAPQMEQNLTAAVQADPDFTAPYRLLAQERIRRGDRAGAAQAIEQALARGDRISPLDRARLELQSAEITADPAASQSALVKLSKLDPSDSAVWLALGQIAMNHHDYRQAVENLQKAAAIEPGEGTTWNLIGYAAAYDGQLETAMAALRRYEQLNPKEVNPLDSMGDVNLASGRLAEAERFYLEANRKDPNFINQGELLKAAMARLLTGDAAGADKIAAQYFDARQKAKDLLLDYRRAQWNWLTGHHKEAMQQMHAVVQAESPDVAALAGAEIALWNLMLGDRAAAAQAAEKAMHGTSPTARGNAMVAAFLSMPPVSASEWSVRAEQVFGGQGQTQIRNFALAYALVLNKEFPAAQLLFKQMWESGTPVPDEGLPLMLAWCYLETGKTKEAAPLLRFNPIPNINGLTPYTAFYLPRLFYLRGLLAEKEGRGNEAQAEYKKFRDLGGK
jgi:Flp pilus assembly protein TadD